MDFDAGEMLLFDKPVRWTSFDLVRKVKNLTRASKVGHAGTLDPLASGLLILCTGKKTRSLSEFMGLEKEYTGLFTLGESTPGYDREMAPDRTYPTAHITPQMIFDSAGTFTGEILQQPPPHSAVKVEGKRSYKSARKGSDVRPEPRQVTVREFAITEIDFPRVAFRVVCSKGTYIRSLVHDLGLSLGSGAVLDALRRTRIGDFKVEAAWNLVDFQEFIAKQAAKSTSG